MTTMYGFFEDDGDFKAGRILSEADASVQVELPSGKRSKIKRANVLFRFDAPDPEALLDQARAAAAEIDLDFLWQCAPQADFLASELAADYYGHAPTPCEHAGVLLRLHGAPAYFHRRGRGTYRPAPPDILAAALAALEKKRLQAEQQQRWVADMVAGVLPDEIKAAAETLLIKPDKNTLVWKAFDAACTQLARTPEQLLLDLGALPHPLAVHQRRFLGTYFPKGTGFPDVTLMPPALDLPLADVVAYSVDDLSTTEIDDALSVQVLADGQIQVGIHVAAPGLGVTRGSALDAIARARMSTVYMPGAKIPMQPEAVIQAYSLDAGRDVPVLSLYVTADLGSGDVLATDTRLERVNVRENLRHNDLDARVTEAALNDPAAELPDGTKLPYGDWLRPLWQLAQALIKKRDAVRGKPETNSRVEYSFYLDGSADDPDARVILTPRPRHAPLDRLVAEYMILANSVWGGLLAERGVPAIYRSQAAGRVRMSTHALPHEAIGVAQYAWCTSPLRRYVDLVNQWQLLAVAQHGVSARLVAPFKPKDADLFAIIGAFDAQYAAWHDFQHALERYWCLRWLKQQGLTRVAAHVLRDDLARLACAPLVVRVAGLAGLERGEEIEVDIMAMDELSLEVACRLVAT